MTMWQEISLLRAMLKCEEAIERCLECGERVEKLQEEMEKRLRLALTWRAV